ncbi:membrane fusion protein (multidrug efflux system) [Azospirillum fermentarium]|uniref:efflux RND transporter periplasmic adaptor subunit n=1 Tax=Azospirillum fermentarium TaxID=1233114 RepID=UPI00222641F4|nr:efflux RND transporter periplasmic adaptor subunit [Azospirillum fermentarium]MCW2245913.1 membrane fusion protein (multidrug efflux system) [Azospirillum fermentarium]
MRHPLRIALLLVLLALGGAGYWYFIDQSGTVGQLLALAKGGGKDAAVPAAPAAGTPPARPMPVEAVKVKVGAVTRTVTAVGSLMSSESVVIRPEVTGRITNIAFSEGEPVKKGAVLIRLDDAVARATLAQAQASLVFSRADLNRASELFRQSSGTAKAREQALAKLQADEAAVQLAQAQLDKLTLAAPFDGVLGLRAVSVGDVVQPGAAIVNLEAIDQLKLDFRVPEAYLPAVRVGQALNVTVDAFPGRTFQGTVYAINPLLDVNGRAVVIRARVPNAGLELRPGLFARVVLALTENPSAVLVPEQALFAQGLQQLLYRVVDGKAALTKVRIGVRRNGEVEVTEGISPDDTIITGGQIKIRDGAPVAVAGAQNKPAGT